jgi:ribosome-binding factor A
MVEKNRVGRNAGKRQLRVGEELRHALSEILSRAEIRDPDLAGISVTVTAVDISPDLRNATAFVLPLAGANQAAVVDGLNRVAKWLRGQIARRVRLRYTPALVFRLDQSFDNVDRIEALLRRPAVAAGSTDIRTVAAGEEADDGA